MARWGYARPKLNVRVKGSVKHKGYSKKVPDKGAPGRTPESKKWFPKDVGSLHGWHAADPPAERRRHLRTTVRADGYLTTIRRMNAIRNVTTDKPTKRALTSDMAYLKRKYRGGD